MLSGYGWTLFTFFLGHIFLGIFLNWSIQCTAVSMNFKLIWVPSQSVSQFISSRITCHGVLSGPEGQPMKIASSDFDLVSVLTWLLIKVLVPYCWCGRLYCLVWNGYFALGFLIALCLTLGHSWRRLQIPSKNCCTVVLLPTLSLCSQKT